jgi:putative membrane protein
VDHSKLSLFPGVFLRGMLMGAADIVPGVSGGTIAFVTGIYDRLLAALSSADMRLVQLLRRQHWREAWEHTDAAFLLTLLAGIGVSVFSLAQLINFWLETQPLRLWAFFFGLILGSALLLMRHVRAWSLAACGGLLGGALLAALLGVSPALSLPPLAASFFLAGFLAICAMILPGVSGSFVLVLLGMYPRVLMAIESLHWSRLLLLAAGAACGLLLFARYLHYLLHRHHAATLATLTGFLIGSLPVVWPWKLSGIGGDTLTAYPVMPGTYAASSGSSQLFLCLGLMALGFIMVWLLENRWGGLER